MRKRYRTILTTCIALMTVGLVVTLSPKCLLPSQGGQGVVGTALADDDHDGDHHYGEDGYDEEGRDRDDRDRDGYDHEGYSRKGHDREGYDHDGYKHDGHHRDGHYDEGHDHRRKKKETSDAPSTTGGLPTPTYSPGRPVVRQY